MAWWTVTAYAAGVSDDPIKQLFKLGDRIPCDRPGIDPGLCHLRLQSPLRRW
jgi:hypothetical protein